MNRYAEYLISISPYPEAFFRRLYYSLLKDKINWQKRRPRKPLSSARSSKKYIAYIRDLGIEKGDILIVHSSMDALSAIGLRSDQLISELEGLLGVEGTLVMPAYPLFRSQPEESENIHGSGVLVYDPKNTLCSTGLLPALFLRMPGVVRSSFPENSLAARGRDADAMMECNTLSDLPHGEGSSWHYCAQHHAKVLFLGVRAYRSTTMVHVAEDLLDQEWPIKNWYETKKYLIKTSTGNIVFDARVRRQYWSRYNTSLYRSWMFKKEGLLIESYVDGISIGFIPDTYSLVDYIIQRVRRGKLFFAIPRRFWKN